VSRDATLYIDDMIEACRRVMQHTEGLSRTQLGVHATRLPSAAEISERGAGKRQPLQLSQRLFPALMAKRPRGVCK
jgi:hypothetical protein